jgi:hypothetical protein
MRSWQSPPSHRRDRISEQPFTCTLKPRFRPATPRSSGSCSGSLRLSATLRVGTHSALAKSLHEILLSSITSIELQKIISPARDMYDWSTLFVDFHCCPSFEEYARNLRLDQNYNVANVGSRTPEADRTVLGREREKNKIKVDGKRIERC